ncbi:hypothetical protein I6F35_08380 [Bradyrhizobium sp. BRP22]|uniref:hypothetical protein n=1 Tax=Bradyrhizobium sp. BRP22 TaxID=2793821 RepID=UPI001CD4FE34|nr:hypothetical protein [Bradyrhizobium sp. BRP22]MCA1453231.1 hypothetical protein [Bradyrhizobium sp. BRP22]
MIKFDVRLLIVRLSHIERFEKELCGHLRPEERPLEPQMKSLGEPLWANDSSAALTTEAGRKWIWATIGPLMDELKPLGLTACQLEIQHIWNHADRWTRLQLADGFAALRWKVAAELNEKFFLFLDKQDAELFEREEPFGSQMAGAFPSANQELKDAAQCISLGKGTAAVFHAMRAVEIGIRVVAREVGKSFDVQQWNDILNQIESVLGEWRRNGIPGLLKPDKDAKLEYLSRAAAEIGYFKDGWRNYVSHNKRPYDTLEAKSIYEHVGSFMKILSEHLSE